MGTVLIADDDSLVRLVLRAALERRGCTVTEVADGDAVLASLGSADYDVCIMDEFMPGAGLRARVEAVRRLRPPVALLVITGRREQSGDGAPGVTWVRKPVSAEQLDAALASALRNAGEHA